MGNYTGTIQFRVSQANTSAGLVSCFNSVHAAFIGCGMTQVSDANFTGQAGTFVTTTPGSGETQVVIGTTSAGVVVGYKVYKHPTLAVYIRVEFLDIGNSATTSRHAALRFTVGTAIAAGTFTGGTVTVFPIDWYVSTGTVTTSTLTSNVLDLYASCGDDHFWIYCKATAFTLANNSYAAVPADYPGCAIGVFSGDQSSDNLMLMMPPVSIMSGTSYYGPNQTAMSPLGPAATRYWINSSVAGTWAATKHGSAGCLPDVNSSSVSAGVRVARAQKVINSAVNKFDFGFVNSGVVADGTLIDLNLDGAGSRKYRVCNCFGPSNPSYVGATINDVCAPALPWDV